MDNKSTSFWEVLDSNFGPETTYPEQGFSEFLQANEGT
jgi:hypothetical protein